MLLIKLKTKNENTTIEKIQIKQWNLKYKNIWGTIFGSKDPHLLYNISSFQNPFFVSYSFRNLQHFLF